MQYTTNASISQVPTILTFCADYLRIRIPNIKLRHIIQPETGQTALRCFLMTAAAIDVNDAVTMPYPEGLVTDAGQKVDRRVADDADGVRVRTSIFWLDASPDARITVSTGTTMNKVKLLSINGNVQMIRQSSQEAQDHVTLMGRAMVE